MVGHRLLWFIILLWNEFCIFVCGGKNCSVEELQSCAAGETCEQIQFNSSSGICNCLRNYTRSSLSGLCVPNSQDPSQDFSNTVSASAIAVGLLVPVISIIIIGGLVFSARRYRWIHRFRDQAHQLTVRSYDTVLVANEDDAPIG